MVSDLFIPRRDFIVPKMPSYVKLDMAFGIGAGAQLMDKSRYRSHGTISGAAWATGAHGRCLDFDPTEPSYVEIAAADSTQLDFTSEDFSIVCRVYIDDLTGYRWIFSRGITNGDGYEFRINITDGIPYLNTNQSGAVQTTVGGTLTTGVWYTLGVSRDGAAVKIYANGVDVTSTSGTHIDPATSARSAKIGIYDNKVAFPFDGKIEFLRIFGGIALSASEHLAWHNALA